MMIEEDIKQNWTKLERDLKKAGLREGISDGRDGNFQGSFDVGYKEGFRNGFEIGKLKATHLLRSAEDAPELLDKPSRGWCQICLNPRGQDQDHSDRAVDAIIRDQNEAMGRNREILLQAERLNGDRKRGKEADK